MRGGGGKVNPASTIEFSPLSEEIEKQKEAAAKSMAEKFKIQSPFPAIFSGLSEEKPQTEEPELLLEEEDAPIELLAPEEDESVELLSVEEDESPELLSAEEDAPIELLALEEDDSEAEPQAPMESEAKPLNMYFVKPLLSVPFSAALNTEINVLEVHDVDDDATPEPVIAKRNGVPYINEGTRNPDKETIKGLDRNFKRLVESVLVND